MGAEQGQEQGRGYERAQGYFERQGAWGAGAEVVEEDGRAGAQGKGRTAVPNAPLTPRAVEPLA